MKMRRVCGAQLMRYCCLAIQRRKSRVVDIDRQHLKTVAQRDLQQFSREDGRVTVEELASRFVTSAVTIRTDLTALEKSGAAVRTPGGALLPQDTKIGRLPSGAH